MEFVAVDHFFAAPSEAIRITADTDTLFAFVAWPASRLIFPDIHRRDSYADRARTEYWVVDSYDRQDSLVSRSRPYHQDMANTVAMASSHQPHVARTEVMRISEEVELVFINGALTPLQHPKLQVLPRHLLTMNSVSAGANTDGSLEG